jgi:hypothetical protein
MKPISKISGLLAIATLLTFTLVHVSMTEADAQSDRGQRNQDARQECNQRGAVVGACVGAINANVEVVCSVGVLARIICT